MDNKPNWTPFAAWALMGVGFLVLVAGFLATGTPPYIRQGYTVELLGVLLMIGGLGLLGIPPKR